MSASSADGECTPDYSWLRSVKTPPVRVPLTHEQIATEEALAPIEAALAADLARLLAEMIDDRQVP